MKVTSAQLRNTQRKGWGDFHQESASPYKRKIEDIALINTLQPKALWFQDMHMRKALMDKDFLKNWPSVSYTKLS